MKTMYILINIQVPFSYKVFRFCTIFIMLLGRLGWIEWHWRHTITFLTPTHYHFSYTHTCSLQPVNDCQLLLQKKKNKKMKKEKVQLFFVQLRRKLSAEEAYHVEMYYKTTNKCSTALSLTYLLQTCSRIFYKLMILIF